jgi:hypothetical protein
VRLASWRASRQATARGICHRHMTILQLQSGTPQESPRDAMHAKPLQQCGAPTAPGLTRAAAETFEMRAQESCAGLPNACTPARVALCGATWPPRNVAVSAPRSLIYAQPPPNSTNSTNSPPSPPPITPPIPSLPVQYSPCFSVPNSLPQNRFPIDAQLSDCSQTNSQLELKSNRSVDRGFLSMRATRAIGNAVAESLCCVGL